MVMKARPIAECALSRRLQYPDGPIRVGLRTARLVSRDGGNTSVEIVIASSTFHYCGLHPTSRSQLLEQRINMVG